MKLQMIMTSEIGPLHLVADEHALLGIHWKKVGVEVGENRLLKRAASQLTEYFAGQRKRFELPLELNGTSFQKRVWAALAEIPYGKTISYKELAANIKQESATRAVGTANGRNPISIIIPCHRVIAADGSLGGYAGGLEIKSRLLALEKGKS